MRFYLGTHHDAWLTRPGGPLFVSVRTLAKRKTLPRAVRPWALDSAGFTELSEHGRWTFGAEEYAALVRRYAEEIGQLDWAAPQDWLCTPPALAKTGLTIEEHQRRTVASVVELRRLLGADAAVIPVLQGWEPEDYLAHVEMYTAAGIDLRAEPIVGVGSIAPRQAEPVVDTIVRKLHALGLRLHGFGVKLLGLAAYGDVLASADSLAWSYDARYGRPLPECVAEGRHKTCQNCPRYAEQWRNRIEARLARPQLDLYA